MTLIIFQNKKSRNLILLILLSFGLNSYNLEAQHNRIPSGITLSLDEEPLFEAFSSISRQTGFRFSYDPLLIDDNQPVTVRVDEQPLEEVLPFLLPDSIRYKQIGDYLILSRKERKNTEQGPATIAIEENLTQRADTNKNIELITKELESILSKSSFSDTGMEDIDCLDSINPETEDNMQTYLAALLIAAAPVDSATLRDTTKATPDINHEITVGDTAVKKHKIAQFSFVYPLGTDWVYSSENYYGFSFNLIGGYTGGINGFEMATAFNINRYEVKGVQLAGAFNITGTNREYAAGSRNIQFAAGFNYTGKGYSTQFSGGVNVADTGCFQGTAGINVAKASYAQLAGGANISKTGKFQGSAGFNLAKEATVQLTGGINIAKSNISQLSAGINIAQTTAFQLTGGLNISRKVSTQISGGINIAKESSCQITGGLNITKKGGFQMAVINVRDTADGIPLGIINIVKKGGIVEFGIEGAELLHTSLTFRSGVKQLYTILAFGCNFTDNLYAPGIGLGTSFLWRNRIGLNLELMHYQVMGKRLRQYYDENIYDIGYNGLVQFRPLLHLRIANHFKMFIGPTANLSIQTSHSGTFNLNLPYSIFTKKSNFVKLDFWVGLTGGLKF